MQNSSQHRKSWHRPLSTWSLIDSQYIAHLSYVSQPELFLHVFHGRDENKLDTNHTVRRFHVKCVAQANWMRCPMNVSLWQPPTIRFLSQLQVPNPSKKERHFILKLKFSALIQNIPIRYELVAV